MTVTFQTGDKLRDAAVRYDSDPKDGTPKSYEHTVEATMSQIPGLDAFTTRYIYSAEITGLSPGATYYFVAGGNEGSVSQEYSFRTIRNDGGPIRFVTGGDMSVGPRPLKLMQFAAKYEPDFVLVGGDIAYANDKLEEWSKWDRWIGNWSHGLTSLAGRLTPMVLAIGNHEVGDNPGEPKDRARFYFAYFPQGGESYFRRQFGPHLTVYALDSGHIQSHESQVSWLDGAMAADGAAPWQMAVYHVPLYPTHREYSGGGSVEGRQAWLPVFDKHHLDMAFENHDHTFKRTHLLRGDKVDPEGTLYLGDGCFGQGPRELNRAYPLWYTAIASSTAHFWLVNVSADRATFEAVNEEGQVFDSTELTH